MLQRSGPDTRYGSDDLYEDRGDALNLDNLIAIARRRWKLVAFAGLVGLVLGYVYLATAIPLYTASTRILIDTPETRTAQDVSGVSESFFESGEIDSQVQLIASEAIAEQVVDRLDLVNVPAFWDDRKTPWSIVFGWLRAGSGFLSDQTKALLTFNSSSEPDGLPVDNILAMDLQLVLQRNAAINRVRGALGVQRIGRTYVLDISFTSPNARLAGLIANEYAAAYIDDQLEAKYSATRRASDWLLTRTEELRDQAASSEQAVEAFRQANDLIATSGTLISDQQLAEINGQLIARRAEASLLQARFRRLQEIVRSEDTSAAVSETLSQSITSDLRARYLEASKRFAEISELLGNSHAQAVRQANEMVQLERLMFEELRRVTEVTGNDLQVVISQIAVLERELEGLVGTSNEANETQIQLRELERNATSLRTLYTSFLDRYQESLQTQSFPISDARVISPAETPQHASSPRRARTLVLALLLGGMVGGASAAFMELRDRVFRTGDQVRSELGLEFIGMLPAVTANELSKNKASAKDQNPRGIAGALFNELATQQPPSELRSAAAASGQSPKLKRLSGVQPIMNYSLSQPMTSFAETLRAAKVAADLTIPEDDGRVIGLASVMPNEGKTTVSKNLASLLASQGAKTLLIDGDLRNPGLSRAIVGDAQKGLVEAIIDDTSWVQLLHLEEESGLLMLPAKGSRKISHTSDLLTSPGMRKLLSKAREHFDYIIIDLPPLGPVIDVRAMLPLLDGIVFVVEWGETDRKIVQDTILSDSNLHEKVIGLILNKADTSKLKLYENYQSKGYYYNRYSKYYTS